jgi:hypothetical protein
MAAKRRADPPRVFSEQELESAARELVARAPGLSGSDFKKELRPEYKKEDKRVLEAANRLAARREIHRWSSAKKLRFFAQDPFDTLALTVAEALANGPLGEADLRRSVETAHRGFGDLLKEWLKGALAHGDIYAHRPAKGSKLKRYGITPDLGDLLKKVLAELKKVLSTAAGQRIGKAELLEAIATELGTALPTMAESGSSAREQFLVRLATLTVAAKSDGLISIRELRASLPFDKRQFDQLALDLSRDELVTLHHHDFPTSLSAADRDELVVNSHGTYFVGIALRRAQ